MSEFFQGAAEGPHPLAAPIAAPCLVEHDADGAIVNVMTVWPEGMLEAIRDRGGSAIVHDGPVNAATAKVRDGKVVKRAKERPLRPILEGKALAAINMAFSLRRAMSAPSANADIHREKAAQAALLLSGGPEDLAPLVVAEAATRGISAAELAMTIMQKRGERMASLVALEAERQAAQARARAATKDELDAMNVEFGGYA